MEIDRDTLVEIVAAFGPVLLMIAVLAAIGTRYAGDEGLSPDGGWALLGTIVAFVLLMTAVGLALAQAGVGYEPDDESGSNGESDDDADAEATDPSEPEAAGTAAESAE